MIENSLIIFHKNPNDSWLKWYFPDDEEKKDFFTALGSGSAGEVPAASKCDVEFEKETADKMTLYKVSDASGQLKVEEIASGSIRKEMLDSDVNILFIYIFLRKKIIISSK